MWTQHSRKYANQRGTPRSVMQTMIAGTVVVALAEASEEKKRAKNNVEVIVPPRRT